ncbi:polysaccharide deacetylase family protein [Siccirubricoccus sp. KC 17139]|uniref:Chitooligosaccharide deacetylase n=1 Tax=Siccirubricoccus soli TaxID=2899147 RepID=A0ABT1D4K6_9PROT|nr:polysaccharide deacetylase family protein [Siccirubricoccus soli]MCO6416859.1 polysaccharide deacetylase family protein [Siccirubricoccus soli]MCP2682994.1 polysaccharide deacetylase family protein [Siccirubricoccus soli]
MRRDLVGYGLNPPRLAWPGGAAVAVSIVVNYEEGAEMAIEAGDPENERIGEVISVVPPGRRDYGQEAIFSYGTRAGLGRFLEAFDRHGVKVSFFMCGRAVERSPELAAECIRRGHEAANHGWVWRPNADYASREEEAAALRRAAAAIKAATGEQPVGFFCRGSPSPWTRELLAEQGYLYDSNAFDDDLPYWDREVKGGPMLVLPYALDCNDMKFFHPNGFVVPEQFVQYAEAALDQLIEEGERGVPKLLNIGLHLRICGRPARFRAVEGILRALARRKGKVWVARRRDIAEWVRGRLPPG